MLKLKAGTAPRNDAADYLACQRRQRLGSDLAAIIRYVANVNPVAARRLRQLLMESVLPVSEHPHLYRQSQTIPAVREIAAHPDYIVYYRVTASCIEAHGAELPH